MGIGSVAVYADPDRDAMHVSMADQAVAIGPAASAKSYLNIERIIQAAQETGADAIHPGYGFLSENGAFVRACQSAEIIFIGPDAESIEAMGLKDAAKKLMEQSGVPVVPGYHGDNQNAAFLATQADQLGYPVLIKARAGGGGKGMRKVESASDFEQALAGAQREGGASFGDDRVLVEKYVGLPRHIEIQVFGDRHGNVVHLFERDCSLQRRHQKVIEEAPAPGMTAEMRLAMGQAAVQAASAVNYVGAGTVEFIVDVSDGLRPDRFYFMEMNTRLQVEHPVTESVTGIDLVKWQIEIAAGQPLPLGQQDISLQGHSFEARIYAEDTDNGFLPATGTLDYMQLDKSSRIDTGVRQGDTISPFYDPMIAKMIVHGPDRATALTQLTRALGNSRIAGCTTNLGFLGRLSALPQFVSGDVETGLIEQHDDFLRGPTEAPDKVFILATLHLAGMLDQRTSSTEYTNPWLSLSNWRSWGTASFSRQISYQDQQVETTLEARDSSIAKVIVNDTTHEVEILELSDNQCRVRIDGNSSRIGWFYRNHLLEVFCDNQSFQLLFEDPLEAAADESMDGNLVVAPMPGSIINIAIKPGDSVMPDDTLIIMEAMKMEHTLKAVRAGSIEELLVSVGDQVDAGAVLLSLMSEEKSNV